MEELEEMRDQLLYSSVNISNALMHYFLVIGQIQMILCGSNSAERAAAYMGTMSALTKLFAVINCDPDNSFMKSVDEMVEAGKALGLIEEDSE